MNFTRFFRPRHVAGRMNRPAPVMAEVLEGRLLMSRVQLDSFAVQASGAVGVSNLKLRTGVDYLVQASGTLYIRTQNNRLADAEFGQVLPDYHWQDINNNNFDWGIGLGDGATGTITKVAWGPFAEDHVYTTTHTGAGKKLAAQFFDDQYNDNSGSITMTIFSPEQFNADLKVFQQANMGNSTTVIDGTAGDLSLAKDVNGQGIIKIAAADSLPTDYANAGGTWDDTAKAFFVWNVAPVAAGTTNKTTGDLKGGNTAVTLTDGGGTNGGDFVVNSGFDTNGNGTLDSGEGQRTINVHLV